MSFLENEPKWLKHLRDDLQNQAEMPPNQVWLQIEAELNREKSTKVRFSRLIWLGVAASIIFIGLAINYTIQYRANFTDQSDKVISYNEKKVRENQANKSIYNIVEIKSIDSCPKFRSDLIAVKSNLSRTDNNFKQTSMNFSYKMLSDSTNLNSADYIESYLTNKLAYNLTAKSLRVYNFEQAESFIPLNNPSNFQSHLLNHVQRSRLKEWQLGAVGNWVSSGQYPRDSPQSLEQKGIASTFSRTSEVFSKEIGGTENPSNLLQLARQELSSIRIIGNWSAGLQFTLPINKEIEFETGVLAQQMQLIAPLRYSVYDVSQNRFTSTLFALSRAGNTDLSIWPLQTNEHNYLFSNWYMQIPVRTIFSIGQKRLRVHISAGASWHRLIASQTKYSFSIIENNENVVNFNSYYTSIQLGVGFSYRLNNRLKLFTEPNYLQAVNSILKSDILSYKPSIFSMQGGISFIISANRSQINY